MHIEMSQCSYNQHDDILEDILRTSYNYEPYNIIMILTPWENLRFIFLIETETDLNTNGIIYRWCGIRQIKTTTCINYITKSAWLGLLSWLTSISNKSELGDQVRTR